MNLKLKETKKSKLIIGDVHGCFDELEALLNKVNYSRLTHDLYFVGDLINKGPDSVSVLNFAQKENAKIVLGNHEWGLLKVVRGERKSVSLNKVVEQMGDSLQKWVSYIESWPLFIEEEDLIMVHGGLEPRKELSEMSKKVLCTIRTWDGVGEDLDNESHPPWYELYEGKKPVIYGHWALQGLKVRENTVGLDSGCCYGEQLSAYLLPEKEVIQVSAYKNYVTN